MRTKKTMRLWRQTIDEMKEWPGRIFLAYHDNDGWRFVRWSTDRGMVIDQSEAWVNQKLLFAIYMLPLSPFDG